MQIGVSKQRNDRKGGGISKLTTKRMVDFLLAQVGSGDLPSATHSRRLLYHLATKAALELGASRSKIDSLMMFYAAGLDEDSKHLVHGNVLLGGFLDHIETLGPKASRKVREAAVKSMVRVGAHRRACRFTLQYLGRALTQEEFAISLEVHYNSAMYCDKDDQKMIAWATEFSQALAGEVAAKLEARMKAAGYHK